MKDTTKAKVKAITEQLEQGVKDLFSSDRFAEYLQTMAKFHIYSARYTRTSETMRFTFA